MQLWNLRLECKCEGYLFAENNLLIVISSKLLVLLPIVYSLTGQGEGGATFADVYCLFLV